MWISLGRAKDASSKINIKVGDLIDRFVNEGNFIRSALLYALRRLRILPYL